MNRITNEQREAIVRKAVAERDALLRGEEPDKGEAHRLLSNLATLRKRYDDSSPPLDEQGERAYKDWAYAMSDAWDEAYRYLGLPTFAASPSTTRQQEVGSGRTGVTIKLVRAPNGETLRMPERNESCNCAARRTLCDGINCVRPGAAPSTPEKAGGVPAFDPTQPCLMQSHTLIGPAPTMTYCQRCKNPHHACDGGVPSPIPHPLPAQANDGGEHG